MKKFTLLFITIISVILLTSCINIDFGKTETPTPTVDTTPTTVTEYSVTFMNGDKIYKTQSIQEGMKISKPEDPKKDGYVFICWSTSSSVKNEFNFNNPITSDIVIYAYFEAEEIDNPIMFTITFMNGSNIYLTLTVEKGQTITKPTDPNKTGYSFICWSINETNKQEFDFNTIIRDDFTLYAYYEVIEEDKTETPDVTTYTVTFMNGSNVYQSATINEGNKVTKPVNPSKTGYNFICWSTSPTSKQEYDFHSIIRDNLTLYAYFEVIEDAPVITTYNVIFMNGSSVHHSTTINGGNKITKPTDPVKAGYNFICWSTSSTSKNEYNFNTVISTDLTLYAYFEVIENNPSDTPVEDQITVTKFSGYNEGAYIEFESNGYNPSDFTITYTKENYSTKYTVDSELIRNNGSTIRCDILGLVKGTYHITIKNKVNNNTVKKAVNVSNHDRSGYAHFDNTVGVGAYNDDGSLKTNAIVIYVNDSNKNTVTAKFGSKTYTGLGAILAAAKDSSYPLCIRILGSVKTAQWNPKSHGEGSSSSRNQNLANTFSGVTFSSGKLSYSAIVSAGINSMSNDINNGISILNGLTTNVIYSSGEYDSYYNMLDISKASNVTIEGVGTNATIYQWGFNFKQCNNIEVRNLTFDRYTEDAVAFEGDKNDISKYGNYWLHNCTFNIGVNNWDVSYEADKYDGDGSTDIKYCRGVTVSYTTYNNTHKTMLIGGNDESKQYNITLHHNYFNNCKSRLPLVRQANIHIYNNYFYKTTDVCSSVRANSSAFFENNYYDQAKNPFMLVKNSSYTGTSIKTIGNYFNNCSISNSNTTNTYSKDDNTSSRTSTITGSCNPTGSKELINFDTNSSLFYYDSINKVSDVENLLSANLVKDHCLKLSGVLKADFISDVQPEQPSPDNTTPEQPSNPDEDDNNTENPVLETKYISFENFTTGKISSDLTVNGVKLISGGKDVTVTEKSVTLAGKSITKYIKLGGGGAYNVGCINFDIDATANITVYYECTNTSSRYAALFDSTNKKTSATTEANSSTGIVNYTFNNVSTGNYSIGSANSGLNIYLIVIEYI